MALLSVIVPVYNTERYLSKCLDSIIGQTMQDMEIICIDDGSTDSCPDILGRYARQDARIRIIRKENEGLVSARKTGVSVAKGKYTGYVDSDDWIEPEMYEKLYEYAVKNQADMVSSGYFYEGNYVSKHWDNVPEGMYDEDRIHFLRENSIFNFQMKDVGIRASLCCKLFLTEKLKKVQMNIPAEISIAEDKICVVSYLLICKKAYILKEAFYHYIIHQESMVHVPDTQYLLKVNMVYQYFIGLYRHPSFTDTMRLKAEFYITEMLYKGINSRMGFLNENLLWIDPVWMEQIPIGSRILLYGDGALGRKYYQQIQNHQCLDFAGCIDFGFEKIKESDFVVKNPLDWVEIEFDIVVITIKNPDKAEEVRERLCKIGIASSQIYHFEQKELFWRFAEADGILRT